MRQRQRDIKMDSIKGLLIILVVLGHCLENTSNEGMMRVIYNGIYSFHMPLFVFISGYFTNIHKDKKQMLLSIINLILIYIIFQSIKSIPDIIEDRFSFTNFIIYPQWTMWYLLSIIYWRTASLFIKLCSIRINYRLVVLTFLISILCGYIPYGNEFSIQRTLFYCFPFTLGLYIREKQKISLIYNIKPYIILLALILSIAAILLFNERNMYWLLYGNCHYLSQPITLELCPIVRIAQIILSTLVCIVFVKFCPSKSFLANIGKSTMFIYIYHSSVINMLKYINFNCNDVCMLFISLILTFATLYIFNKIPIFHYLINPLNSTREILFRPH